MKRKKIITWIVVGVLALGVAGAGVAYSQGLFGSSEASAATTYSVVRLTTGNLEKSVTGTGALTSGGTVNETAPLDVTLDKVSVAVGQSVKAGDTLATVDADSVTTLISTLQTQIDGIDTQLAQMTASQASVSTLTASVGGRVKAVYAAVGDSVDAVVAKNGGVLLLSTDGKMKLDFAISDASLVAIGDSVKVKIGSKKYTGLVETLDAAAKTCTVTLSDNGPALDAEAIAYTGDGDELGAGKLAINRPYLVTASGGSVSKVYVDEGDKVSQRTKLFYIVGVPLGSSYDDLLATRADTLDALNTAKALLESGKITATQDGVVSAVNVANGQAVKAGDPLAALMTGGAAKLVVTVDELDINSVSVGQSAKVAVDAFTGEAFTGTVESISDIGATTSGVTTYKVTIRMDASDKLKIGMNATATIVIEKHEGALLLPMTALNTSRGASYVWLYTGTLPTDTSQDPGVRTEVKTGMSNANYVEITEGLTADDQVVVVRTRSANSTTNARRGNMEFPGMGGGFTGGMGDGGQMPPGGMGGGGFGGGRN